MDRIPCLDLTGKYDMLEIVNRKLLTYSNGTETEPYLCPRGQLQVFLGLTGPTVIVPELHDALWLLSRFPFSHKDYAVVCAGDWQGWIWSSGM